MDLIWDNANFVTCISGLDRLFIDILLSFNEAKAGTDFVAVETDPLRGDAFCFSADCFTFVFTEDTFVVISLFVA